MHCSARSALVTIPKAVGVAPSKGLAYKACGQSSGVLGQDAARGSRRLFSSSSSSLGRTTIAKMPGPTESVSRRVIETPVLAVGEPHGSNCDILAM